jgi:signal transduction histidine kinase
VGLRPPHPSFLRAADPSALVLAAAIACVVTLLGAPTDLDLATRRPLLHVVLETGAGIIALIAAILVVGRSRDGGRAGDLVLASGLTLFAAANVAFSAVPSAIAGGDPSPSAIWAAVVARTLGALALAASPFVDQLRGRQRHSLTHALVAVVALLGVFAAVGWGFASGLPVPIDTAVSPKAFDWPSDAHVLALVAHVGSTVLFLVAAIGFARRAVNGGPLPRWLAPGCILAAFANLNYFLYPSLYTAWVSTGDLLRVAFYVLVFAGAAQEIAYYQRERLNAATLDERRRLARDFHDGLAQELAFLTTQTRLLATARSDVPGLERLNAAAQRALDESRLAIAALARPGSEPFEVAVAATAEDIAYRAGANISFDLASGVEVSPEKRDPILRIVREAVTNAVRHGRVEHVAVKLETGEGIRLSVIDSGVGFDAAADGVGERGLGLRSMRERAEGIGGRLTVVSGPGAGTSVELELR